MYFIESGCVGRFFHRVLNVYSISSYSLLYFIPLTPNCKQFQNIVTSIKLQQIYVEPTHIFYFALIERRIIFAIYILF